MSSPTTVLFVCMHNTVRSRIATALANHRHADVLDARSAGVNPDAQVSAVAARVLAAQGIDVSG